MTILPAKLIFKLRQSALQNGTFWKSELKGENEKEVIETESA